MAFHEEKLEELLKRLSAQFLEREGNRDAIISVTRVEISRDSKYGKIFITVFPESKEAGVMEFAKRKRGLLHKELRENIRSRVVPFISIEIDKGEKKRLRMEELLKM